MVEEKQEGRAYFAPPPGLKYISFVGRQSQTIERMKAL